VNKSYNLYKNVDQSPSEKKNEKQSFCSIFHTTQSNIIEEMDLWEIEPRKNIQAFDEIYEFWDSNSDFPVLKKIVMDLLSAPLSTAFIERKFSHASNIILDYHRNRLSETTFKKLLLLHDWISSAN
jgi:hypothetical protein